MCSSKANLSFVLDIFTNVQSTMTKLIKLSDDTKIGSIVNLEVVFSTVIIIHFICNFCTQSHERGSIAVILRNISYNYFEDKIKTSSKTNFSPVTMVTSKATSDDHHVMIMSGPQT